MLECVYSRHARRDIALILHWSEDHFGEKASLRYEDLIVAAIKDLATAPDRLGSTDRSSVLPGCRIYHLYHSRRRIPRPRVKNPRHFVVFRVRGQRLEVGRILHDEMDIDRRIAEEAFADFE
jgi:toxin ParE1/3/4